MELRNENYSPNWYYAYLILFMILTLMFVSYLLFMFYNVFGPNEIGFLLIIGVLVLFYAFLSYNEYYARYDKIILSMDSVEYQNSPKFVATGWLTKSGKIKYSEIDSIQVMRIKSGIDLLEEKLNPNQIPDEFFKNPILIQINLKSSESIRIGERLPPKKVFQIALLLEGRAELGNLYRSFQEKFPKLGSLIDETVGKLKGIIQQKKEE